MNKNIEKLVIKLLEANGSPINLQISFTSFFFHNKFQASNKQKRNRPQYTPVVQRRRGRDNCRSARQL